MIKKWIPSWPLSLTIFIFWLLLNSDISISNVIMALILAVLVPTVAARLDREFARIGSLRLIPKMLVVLAIDIVASNIEIARRVLGSESVITPGFIWVPLDIGNIHGISVLTSIITLTPGTLSASLSDDRRYLLVHVFNLKDRDEVVRQIKERYEVPLMEIFP